MAQLSPKSLPIRRIERGSVITMAWSPGMIRVSPPGMINWFFPDHRADDAPAFEPLPGVDQGVLGDRRPSRNVILDDSEVHVAQMEFDRARPPWMMSMISWLTTRRGLIVMHADFPEQAVLRFEGNGHDLAGSLGPRQRGAHDVLRSVPA